MTAYTCLAISMIEPPAEHSSAKKPSPRQPNGGDKTEPFQSHLEQITLLLRNSYAMCRDTSNLETLSCTQFKDQTRKTIKAIQSTANNFLADEEQKKAVISSSCKYLESSVGLVTAVREYQLSCQTSKQDDGGTTQTETPEERWQKTLDKRSEWTQAVKQLASSIREIARLNQSARE